MSTAENAFDMDVDLEGADGHDGGSGLQAAIAASRRAETKSAQVEFAASLSACRAYLLAVWRLNGESTVIFVVRTYAS